MFKMARTCSFENMSYKEFSLSHYNPCNTAIASFIVSHMCEIRINDVKGQSTMHIYSYAKILKHG